MEQTKGKNKVAHRPLGPCGQHLSLASLAWSY